MDAIRLFEIFQFSIVSYTRTINYSQNKGVKLEKFVGAYFTLCQSRYGILAYVLPRMH